MRSTHCSFSWGENTTRNDRQVALGTLIAETSPGKILKHAQVLEELRREEEPVPYSRNARRALNATDLRVQVAEMYLITGYTQSQYSGLVAYENGHFHRFWNCPPGSSLAGVNFTGCQLGGSVMGPQPSNDLSGQGYPAGHQPTVAYNVRCLVVEAFLAIVDLKRRRRMKIKAWIHVLLYLGCVALILLQAIVSSNCKKKNGIAARERSGFVACYGMSCASRSISMASN
jgi:hypothetical protein